MRGSGYILNAISGGLPTRFYFAQPASPVDRAYLYEVFLARRANAKPTEDASSNWTTNLERFTAEDPSPGGVALTPQALDSASPAASTNGVADPLNPPVYTAGARVLSISGGNSRDYTSWVAEEEREIVVPAVGDNGIGLLTLFTLGNYQMQGYMKYVE